MTPTIRLVALDVDGTLTTSTDEVTDASVTAIQATVNAGVPVVLATGRAPHGCERVLERLGVPVGLVAVNGAVVYERFGTAPWASRMLSPKLARGVAAEILACGLEPLVWDDPSVSDGIVLQRPEMWLPGFVRNQLERVRHAPVLSAWLDHPTMTVVAVGDELPMRDVWARLSARFGREVAIEIGVYPPDPIWTLTVLAPGCDKAVGVMEYADRLGIPEAEVMAIGDGFNDLTMLRAAGWAVAMGNAGPEVRAAADAVVADHDHDGVAEALRRFVPAVTEAR